MSHESSSTRPPTPRARRRKANVERILEAAVQVAVEDGIDQLSIARVASLADYTPGALYRYFASKDAILAGVVERIVGELGGQLRAADATQEEPLARIAAQVRAYHRFAVTADHSFRLVAAMIGDPRVLLPETAEATKVMEAMIRALSPLAAAFERAAESRAIVPCAEPETTAERVMILFSAFHGALQLRKQARVVPNLMDVDRIAFQTVRLLLRGWGADAAAIEDAFASTANP